MSDQVRRFGGFGIAMLQESPAREYVLASDFDEMVTQRNKALELLKLWQENECLWGHNEQAVFGDSVRRLLDSTAK